MSDLAAHFCIDDACARCASHPAAIYLRALVPSSQRRMRLALDKAARVGWGVELGGVPWASVRASDLVRLRTALASSCSLSDANVCLCGVRGVLRALLGDCDLPAPGTLHALSVGGVRGSREPAGRHVAAREVAQLLAGVRDNAHGLMVRAVVLVLYATGARVAELCGAQLSDLATDGSTLRVVGKGNRGRTLPLSTVARRALGAYLAVRGDRPGPLFVGGGTASRLGAGELGPDAVRSMLARLSTRAGLATVRPHDLRRTFTGELLARGVDVVRVQRLMGHASAATTARYDRRALLEGAQAVELLPDPEGEI